MTHLLTRALLFFWTALFALLALACALEPDSGLGAPLRLLGVEARDGLGQGSREAAVLAAGFLLVAVLFFWALLNDVLDRLDAADSAHAAFAGAVMMLMVVLLACAAGSVRGCFQTLGVLLAVNLASYLVIAAGQKRQGASEPRTGVARSMARGAAHTSLLRALSGRNERDGRD